MREITGMVKRVFQVVQHLAPGGIETMVLDLQRLAGPQMETHIVSLEGTQDAIHRSWPRAAAIGARLHCLDKKPGVQPSLVTQLAALFLRMKPAVVHTHHIGPLLYGGLAARLAGVPRLIHTEHDAWHLALPRRRHLERMALCLVGPRVVAAGMAVAAGLAEAVPSCRPLVMASGVDTARFSPGDRMEARRRLGLPRDARIVGAAGRLELVKGHDLLIEAMRYLPDDVHVAIAGDGSRRATLEEQVRALGLVDRIHFLGHTEDVVGFYRALDVFCQPSRSEGLPLAVLEAQSCGIRVVATNVGGVREALCPVNSVLVAPKDPDVMALTLGIMLDAPAHGSPRGFILANHDLDHLACAYRALLTA